MSGIVSLDSRVSEYCVMDKKTTVMHKVQISKSQCCRNHYYRSYGMCGNPKYPGHVCVARYP